jgi:hypothetical protein
VLAIHCVAVNNSSMACGFRAFSKKKKSWWARSFDRDLSTGTSGAAVCCNSLSCFFNSFSVLLKKLHLLMYTVTVWFLNVDLLAF